MKTKKDIDNPLLQKMQTKVKKKVEEDEDYDNPEQVIEAAD